jgi:hypothetical protein
MFIYLTISSYPLITEEDDEEHKILINLNNILSIDQLSLEDQANEYIKEQSILFFINNTSIHVMESISEIKNLIDKNRTP